jgi:hypothetical protein
MYLLSTVYGTEHGRTVWPAYGLPVGADNSRVDRIRRLKLLSHRVFSALIPRELLENA